MFRYAGRHPRGPLTFDLTVNFDFEARDDLQEAFLRGIFADIAFVDRNGVYDAAEVGVKLPKLVNALGVNSPSHTPSSHPHPGKSPHQSGSGLPGPA